MDIEKAIRVITSLTEAELSRYVQLCEIDIIEYKESTKHYTTEQKLKYATPYIRNMKDNKAMFMAELESRKAKEPFPNTPKTGFEK